MALFPEKNKKPEEKKPVDPTEAFAKALEAGFKGLSDGMNKNFQALQQSLAGSQARQQEPTKKEAPPEPDDAAIDRMTNSQMMKHLMGQITNVIDSKVKPVAESSEEANNNTEKLKLTAAFEKVKAANPDFDHFRSKMAELVKKNPALAQDPEDLYHLAKAKSPEIVQKLQEESKTAEEKKSAETKQTFGGLFPTNRAPAEKSEELATEDGKPPTTKAILEKNWDLVMKDIPNNALAH